MDIQILFYILGSIFFFLFSVLILSVIIFFVVVTREINKFKKETKEKIGNIKSFVSNYAVEIASFLLKVFNKRK